MLVSLLKKEILVVLDCVYEMSSRDVVLLSTAFVSVDIATILILHLSTLLS